MDERPHWEQQRDLGGPWADLPDHRPDDVEPDVLDLFFVGEPPRIVRLVRRAAGFVVEVLDRITPHAR